MSARKKSWFGIAKSFVKAVEKANAQSQSAAKSKASRVSAPAPAVAPSITVTFTNDEGRQYVGGFGRMPHIDKYETSIKNHLTFIANFYKEHASEYSFDDNSNPIVKLVHDLYPIADAHTCPYCGVIHDFTASRARKCPDCGKQMIVRQGVFLKEEQVAKLDEAISKFYDKSGLINQLKNIVSQIQSYTSDQNYGKAFLSIAEGYQYCAAIFNKHYEGGFGAWDYSWKVLNGEALEITSIGTSSVQDSINNGYAEVIFARGMHCLRELKYSETTTAMNKYAKMAVGMFYSYLLTLDAVGLIDWQQESATKNIWIAQTLGKLSAGDIKDLQARALTQTSPKPSNEIYNGTIRKVEEYVFLENDPVRIKQYIY